MQMPLSPVAYCNSHLRFCHLQMILNLNSRTRKVYDNLSRIRLQKNVTVGFLCAITTLLLTLYYFFIGDASFISKR
jgi:hypothetical protein